jgi:hypothetical protein
VPSTSPKQTRNIEVIVSIEISSGRGAEAPLGAMCEELEDREADVTACNAECSCAE